MADEPKASADQTTTQSFDWKGLSQRTWVIVIGGILFPPVGMILTWLKPGWSARLKWIVTGVLVLLLIARNQPKPGLPSEAESVALRSQDADVVKPGVEATVEHSSFQSDGEPRTGRTTNDLPGQATGTRPNENSSRESRDTERYRQGVAYGKQLASDFAKGNRQYADEPERWKSTLERQLGVGKRDWEEAAGLPGNEQEAEERRGCYEGFKSVVQPWIEKAEAEIAARNAQAAAQQAPRRADKDNSPRQAAEEEQASQAASTTAAARPATLPLKRNWFESDESYFTRGVAALAKQVFSSNDAVCELAAASTPWKGFRGNVKLDEWKGRVEVHPSGSSFVVVFYTFSKWVGFPADFYDAAGKKITMEDFCKRAYGKTSEEMSEIFEAEQDKHQTAQSLWSLATNEAALRRRLPGRFAVEGTVFEIEKKYGSWQVRLFVHENERGVDRWVECLMKNGKGLDKVAQGSRVTIEGVFSRKTFAGPEMKDCTLVE